MRVNVEDVESPSINFSLIRESPRGIVLERFWNRSCTKVQVSYSCSDDFSGPVPFILVICICVQIWRLQRIGLRAAQFRSIL